MVQPSDSKPSVTEARKESEYQRLENTKKGLKKARCKGCRAPFNGTVKQRDSSKKVVEKCQKCWMKEVTCRKCKMKGDYAGKCTKPSKTNARGAGSDNENKNDSDEELEDALTIIPLES